METSKPQPKFTKGEKCIYVHLMVTFLILLILVLIFFVHLCVVNHGLHEVFRVTRRSLSNESADAAGFSHDIQLVGAVYLNITPTRTVCNSVLLHQKWSLAPAHCVAIYSDPDMANFLASWRLNYHVNNVVFKETEIRRNIVHSKFSRDDFSNNIGLFEHLQPIQSSEYAVLPKTFKLSELLHNSQSNNMKIIDSNKDVPNLRGTKEKNINSLRLMSIQKCKDYVLPITQKLRNYEFCVALIPKKTTFVYHGAAVFVNSEVVGIFSWGDKSGNKVPFVILNVFYYRNWLKYIMDV